MKIVACESCKGRGVRNALPCHDCNARGTIRVIETQDELIDHVLSLPEPTASALGVTHPPHLYVVRSNDTPETQT